MRCKPPRGALRQSSLAIAAIATATSASADSFRNGYTYSSASSCAASGRYPSQICGNAEKNAAAEFEEKAPRFASREACERALHTPCSIGFSGAGGWSGKKSGVYFSPRQQGFRINTAANGHDVSVIPVAGGDVPFSTRSAVHLDVRISPQASRFWTYQPAPSFRPGQAAGGAAFGVSSPDGVKGEVPPKPPVDPNFDCAAYLDPAAGGDPSTGCAPAPSWRK